MKITHNPNKYPSHKQYRLDCPACHEPGKQGKTLSINPVLGVYRCFRCDARGRLDSDTAPPSRQRIDAATRAAENIRREQERASRKARQLFGQARETGSSPYLERKQVAGYGVRFDGNGTLLIPARDAAGKLLTMQRIFPDGRKLFVTYAPKKGGFHLIPGDAEGPILLAEGYATAASLHEATGYTAVCAFDLGNLGPVFQALQTLYPEREIILCADNDPPNPKSLNPGMLAAINLGHQYGCRGRMAGI
ncbi:MAG: toprim domain-containing protein [Candidatus Competibacteraceae bacterium]|nr:toprim domain-containing protein [Candidatus Competibacteraceae bacterium]MCB1803917.1 toprim domain-containing protein [Candidatus Competibacteraceae bacterium]MCB1812330.1 toprim domain-containing protein [Candidatus Competibacteraceae bacterium]